MAKIGQVEKRRGANLPHWKKDGATYAVTFRLADSLPKEALDLLQQQIEAIERKFQIGNQPLSLEELVMQSKARSDVYMKLLDAGYGECLLRHDRCAEIVAQALKYFDGDRYRLHAWCVMPNHVHAVVQPLGTHQLSQILHSWKSFTANAVNKELGRSGPFWLRESYDHLIRDEADFHHHVRYVRENPLAAGFLDWKWVG